MKKKTLSLSKSLATMPNSSHAISLSISEEEEEEEDSAVQLLL